MTHSTVRKWREKGSNYFIIMANAQQRSARDNLRGQKSLGPLKKSLEIAQK